MARPAKPRQRRRGKIETLPSGSLRVKIYAGKDPVSQKAHYLTEVVPAGPTAAKEAEKARTRLLARLDEKRAPRTSATVDQLLERHMELLDVEPTSLASYESLIRVHIKPLLGHVQVGRVDGETLDSFYQQLRTCRAHCRGRRYVEHRTAAEHQCDERCRPHECRPLGGGSLRKIHAILSGAGRRALRWGWTGTNPFDLAEPISAPRPEPHPPTPEQAAAIANEAWLDLDWGLMVWIAMVTGMRRGELCALKWDRVDFAAGVVVIRTSIAQRGRRTWEKDTKAHQQRRISLDVDTLALLEAYRRHCSQRAGIGAEMPARARIFSSAPDGSTWLKPDTVSQKYARMCARLGWNMNIHQLRHYSATELIAAGVDVRTVAGRLGHGGGGTTTLRVYSAWVSEADQRASGHLASRMPKLPAGLADSSELTPPAKPVDDSSPYRRIAADLRGAIACGALSSGERLPAFAVLAERYGVSFGTAQRAVGVLKDDGLITVSRGHRAVVGGPGDDQPLAKVVNLR